MSTCPFCQAELSQSDLASRHCSNCDKSLLNVELTGAPTDSRPTIDEGAPDEPAGMQTINDSATPDSGQQQPPTAGKQTIADDAAPVSAGDELATMADIDSPPPTEQRGAPGEPPIATQTISDDGDAADGTGTVDGEIGQTIDESQMSESTGKGTVAEGVPQTPPTEAMQTIGDDEPVVEADEAAAGMQTISDEAAASDEHGTVDDVEISAAAGERKTKREDKATDDAEFDEGRRTVAEEISATLDEDQIETAGLSGMRPAQEDRPTEAESVDESAKPDSSKKTVSGPRIDQTVDVSQMTVDEPERAPGGTVIDVRVDQTVEIPPEDTGDGTVPERAAAATLDSADLEQHLGNTWQGTIGDDVTPGTSLKADIGPATGKTKLVIQERAFRQADEPHLGASDYDVVQMLGEGGMGMVFAARQASIDRTVAVKMLKPKTAQDETQRNKFLAEAVVTGDLEHPNIVPIYDLGHDNKKALFYAMKRVQGTPWDDVIHDKSLTENIEIFMKVADAVGFAHSRKIIHRDLKPENVMLGGYGEVLVMDWGLAIPTDQRDLGGIKPSLSMGGTPAYMAPEMAAGPFDRIGPHSDVYLLGAILYEIVTGRPPHTGKDVMKCLFAAAKNDIIPIQKQGELVDIALRAMATDPEDRYATVTAMQDAIRDYLSHSESIALATRAADDLQQAGTSNDYQDFARAMFGFQEALDLWDGNERAGTGLEETRLAYAASAKNKGDFDLGASLLDETKPEHQELYGEIRLAKAEVEARQQRLKRARRVMRIGVLVFLFVVLGFSGWVWVERSAAIAAKEEAVKERGKAETARDDAIKAKEQEEIQRRQAQINEIAAIFSRQEAGHEEWKAEMARLEEERQRRLTEIQQIVAIFSQQEAGNEEWKAEVARLEEAEQRRQAQINEIAAIFSRQEAGHEEWKAEVARAEEARQRRLTEIQQIFAIFSQQEAGNEEWKADLARQQAVAAKEAEAYEAYVARIVAAFEKIEDNAFVRARELLKDCIPLPGARDFRGWEWGRLAYLCGLSVTDFDLGVPIHCIAFAPGGTHFATGDADGNVKVWDYKGKLLFEPIIPDNSAVQAIAFSPSGGLLATGTISKHDNIKIWDSATGKPIRTLAGDGAHNQGVTSLTFSKDGKRLISTSFDTTAKLWDVTAGNVQRTFKGHDYWVWDASLSADESQLVTVGQDGRAIVWSVASGEALPTFLGHKGQPIYTVAFAPDGQTVATAGYDKRILLWQPSELEEFDFELVAKRFSEQIASGIDNPNTAGISQPKYQALDGHKAAVKDIVIAKFGDQSLLVSSGLDNTVKLWSLETQQLVRSFRGHGEPVICCDVSDDAQWIVSGSNDGFAKLWNIEGYREARVLQGKVLKGHAEAVLWAEFSKDGKHIITASQDRTAVKWTRDGKRVSEFREGHEYLASRVVPFANGARLATAARDNTVRVWDTTSGTQKLVLTGTGRSAAMAVSPNGKWILTGGGGLVDSQTNQPIVDAKTGEQIHNARLWNAETGKLVFDLPLPNMVDGKPVHQQLHHKPVTAVAISPDNKLLCTADGNGRANLWDLTSGKLIKSLIWHNGRITAVAFQGDQENYRLLTASQDMNVAQWDMSTYQVKEALTLVHRPHGEVTGLAVASDSPLVLTSCSDGRVRLWNLDEAKLVRTMQPVDKNGKPLADKQTINDVALSPNGKHVLTVEAEQKTVRVFDVASGQELRFTDGNATGSFLRAGDLSVVWAATFSSDGKHIITVGGDEALTWQFDDVQKTSPGIAMSFRPHSVVTSASFSDDETRVVTVGRDNSVRIWNAETAAGHLKLENLHTDRINTAVFSPDGKEILTACDDGTAKIVNLETKKTVATFAEHKRGLTLAVFSADGTRILTASRDNTARIWIRETGEDFVLQHKAEVLHAAFSPDGKWVVTGSADNRATIWNAAPTVTPLGKKAIGEVFVQLRGHTAPVRSVAFSPDLRCVITGSDDNTAKVWDTTKLAGEGQPLAREVLTLSGHDQPVSTVTFSRDGKLALTGSEDGTAIVWEAAEWNVNQLAIKFD